MAVRKYWVRALVVVVGCFVFWIAFVSWKQTTRNDRIENEVNILEKEAERIRRENETLSEKIHYFSTTDFREQEAKEKLGMKKEQEEVVAIKVQPEQVTEVKEEKYRLAMEPVSEPNIPNYKKWWQVFFVTP